METLKGAGSRDPEPATERDDARLPEQWNWTLQQALYCKRNETQDDSTSSQSAAAAPTTIGGAPKYLESLHQLLFRFGSRK